MNNGWRERWAERENARRLASYQQSLQRWQHDDDLIRHYLELARTANPRQSVDGIKMHKHEHVLWTAVASMVETADTFRLFSPAHEIYSPTRTTGAYLALTQTTGSLRDKGFVAVTNERVIFVGQGRNREWSFANLTGVAHGAQTPMSLLRVSNRQRLSGVVLSHEDAAGFQFFLSLGLAEYRQDRHGFIDHLARLHEHHQTLRPPAPHAVTPALAPHPAANWFKALGRIYFGGPSASTPRKVTPAVATVLVALCMCFSFVSGNNDPVEPPRDTTQAAAGLTQPRTTAPAAVGTAPATAPSSPSVTPTQTAPVNVVPPPTTSKPKTVNLCGAPNNPWGYNFCGGGGTIANPPNEFCSYFNCIKSFWDNTNGYVIQCKDGMFSHSGGRRGSCSHHGGNRRTLRPA